MDDALTRRAFLAAAATAGGIAATDVATAQEDTVTIDMTDGLVFDPDETAVAPGTTVVWENVGSVGHSVTAYDDGVPDGAEYWASGDLESESAARSAYPQQGDVPGGESYEHTFDVEGTYEYFCIPHETVGMVASIEVTTNPDEGGFVSVLPAQAQRLAVWAVAALAGILAFTWALLKYGGEYGEGDTE